MSDNAESGIASTQAKAAQSEGIAKHHKSTIGYLNERTVTFILALFFMLMILLWMTSSSPIVIYTSVTIVVALVILWGILKIKAIEVARQNRQQQAEQWNKK